MRCLGPWPWRAKQSYRRKRALYLINARRRHWIILQMAEYMSHMDRGAAALCGYIAGPRSTHTQSQRGAHAHSAIADKWDNLHAEMKPIKAHLKFSGVWGIIFFAALLFLRPFPWALHPPPPLLNFFRCVLCLMAPCHDIRGWILKVGSNEMEWNGPWAPKGSSEWANSSGPQNRRETVSAAMRGGWIFISIRHKNVY